MKQYDIRYVKEFAGNIERADPSNPAAFVAVYVLAENGCWKWVADFESMEALVDFGNRIREL